MLDSQFRKQACWVWSLWVTENTGRVSSEHQNPKMNEVQEWPSIRLSSMTQLSLGNLHRKQKKPIVRKKQLQFESSLLATWLSLLPIPMSWFLWPFVAQTPWIPGIWAELSHSINVRTVSTLRVDRTGRRQRLDMGSIPLDLLYILFQFFQKLRKLNFRFYGNIY